MIPHPSVTPRRAPAALAVVLAALVAGCSSGGTPSAPAASPVVAPGPFVAPHVTAPASPADSPALSAAPAGTVTPVGTGAEGVVVDPASRSIVVGTRQPNVLVVLDEDTLAVRSRIPLPGHLRHLVAGAPGTVLVPDEDSNRLLTVDLASARVVADIPTGVGPHYVVTAPDGTLFVGDEEGHDVAVLRGGQIVGRLTDAVMPGGMAIVDGRLALVDVAGATLTIYDTATLTRLSTTYLGAGPTHEVSDARGDLVIADTRASALLITNVAEPPTTPRSLPLPGTPYGLAYDAARDRLWVTLTATNQLVGFDTRDGAFTEIARFPTVRQPNTVAVDEASGALLVTGAAEGVLHRIPGPA